MHHCVKLYLQAILRILLSTIRATKFDLPQYEGKGIGTGIPHQDIWLDIPPSCISGESSGWMGVSGRRFGEQTAWVRCELKSRRWG
jgi:hypothetical protein